MKNIVLIVVMLIFLVSCHKDPKNESGLHNDLYNALLDYQKKNPVPSYEEIKKKTPFIDPRSTKYIFEVVFEKKEKDTLVYITLESDGIKSMYKPYGVYKDGNLQPTYIIDTDGSGKNLIKEYKREGLDAFILKDRLINDTMYPVYIYKAQGHQLIVLDSIRGNSKR